jgi:hypothetical protein
MSYEDKKHRHTIRRPRRQRRTFSLAPDVVEYIEQVQKAQTVVSLSAAVEAIVRKHQEAENRTRLEQATAAYFEALSPEAKADERALEAGLWESARELDPDEQP